MQPNAIQFQDIHKRFANSPVLQGISFEVKRGEFFGLVGVNGAGKTTLIKSLLDLSSIDSGRIEILGVDHRLTASRKPMAFLPERFSPPYYLTGNDFLNYMLKLQSLPYSKPDTENMLNALDLDLSALPRPVRSYSKGMAQKLGLAACFLSRKELYVLDEPMSGLDPKARALLKAQIQQLRAQDSTLFFSSHSLADVEEICDRMAILHQGKIVYTGTPAGLCQTYSADNIEAAFLSCISQNEA